MSFYRYYQTTEPGDPAPTLVRQTVPSLDTHECLWTKLEALVNGEWIDGSRSYSGIWLNGDGTATRVRTPPGQPDSPDSSPSSPDSSSIQTAPSVPVGDTQGQTIPAPPK
jgi:hypothetical protein